MNDPFNILGAEFDVPPTFDEAVRNALTRFQTAAAQFNTLYEQAPEERFTDEEWRVVEVTAEDLILAIEKADEGYVAVQYDGNAWYRILESLETISRRLESAIGLMERVRDREG